LFGVPRLHHASDAAGNHFGLNGETPETMLSGETDNISEFAEHRWCNWIKKFRDTTIPHTQETSLFHKLMLGAKHGHWSSHDGQDVGT
jgi:hypothetical protein